MPAPPIPSPLVLHQFAFSHYNEKVRWALDWKGLSATSVNHLPGPHARKTIRVSGQSGTPILCLGDEIVFGSAAILTRLDQLAPTPALFPEEPTRRREVESWVEWFDREVGPTVRLSLFHRVLAAPAFAAGLFTAGQPRWKALPYGLLFPRLVPMLRQKMSINEATDREALDTIRAGLDRVADAVAETGYLVGDRFTAADLTGAALLFPLGKPPGLPFEFPPDAGGVHAAWCARWADHPAVDWMLDVFRRHRLSQPGPDR